MARFIYRHSCAPFAQAAQRKMQKASVSIRRSAGALSSWASLLGFLTVQEFSARFGSNRLGPIFAVGEPIMMISLIVLIRDVIKGIFPLFGTSTTLFISSGVFPFYLFLRLSVQSRKVKYDAWSRLPRVTSTETLLAGTVSEAAVLVMALVLWFACLSLFGVRGAIPVKPEDCLIALSLFATMGVGVGLINAAVIRRFPMWAYIYSIPSRVLMFVSGAYFIIDLMPLRVRNVLVWNPFGHVMEWYRVGQYGDQYPSMTLDRAYCVTWAFMLLLIGFACHRVTLRSERR